MEIFSFSNFKFKDWKANNFHIHNTFYPLKWESYLIASPKFHKITEPFNSLLNGFVIFNQPNYFWLVLLAVLYFIYKLIEARIKHKCQYN